MIFCKVRRTRGVTGAIILDQGSRFTVCFGPREACPMREISQLTAIISGRDREPGEQFVNSEQEDHKRQSTKHKAHSKSTESWRLLKISPQKRLIHMCWMLQLTCCCIQIGPHQSITCTRNKILAWVIFQQLCYPILNMHGWWIWFQFWTLAHASRQPLKESVFNQSSDSLFSTNFALAATKKKKNPQSNWCWLLLQEYSHVNV